ncbi:glucans biosynthesis glucosyltransferase MdoH [Bradyrhizobium guangdongense]|uniref:Glucans biosynthesis glucosyltransferase H n=1 Tax=Bradyrhizobium guangdongense TaxID=1325090 RepID=A0A410V9A0_9BRAD|nr:glucans biosynthesis glucosyltransferase MdoH [Bradyrhizobium guangdongense]QAU40259.1 glucans biosynthesis glucosyltransferase MdoH [Bradyrhizobium guangdongense]QOZ61324.1 glucans biosynthesis glucosyltransferase MdoH [Bradyrhizobium guangdongense]GGI22914.1 glucans biosynthesis glucosyltransferase H [Bradyrhizobium guangdongense]
MGSLNTAPQPVAGDIATQRLLPRETPLPMAPSDLAKNRVPDRVPAAVAPAMAWRRGLILLSTAALTGAGGYEMYRVLEVGGVTVLEAMVLALFLVLLAWVAFSFASALAGFFVLLAHRPDAVNAELPSIASRTAMLLPTYNEDPHRLTARLHAIIDSLEATSHGELFDWYVLSDSTDPDIWVAEEKALLALRRAVGIPRLYYRHRADNTARKAGNISEWITRFGAVYDFMIVLDADSLMSGQTIVRLVRAMEINPTAGLVQTLPMIVNARSLFSRVQQFAGRLYGPMIAAGVAWWHGSEGNYWGHNAIIRVKAFAEAAALPQLRGRKPFGGHILSHDFVEAALMRRAGWGIYMLPTLSGSYEEVPPSLLDFAARDRRWCQGNLQHLAVVPARGLHWVSRLHFMVGIGAYLTAPLWLLFLLLGMLISLQARFVRPEYFPKGFSLFPTWPAQDPVLAIWVFGATMGLLLLPKLLSLVLLWTRRSVRRQFGGALRVSAGVIAEIVVSALMAPVMMIFQSIAVVEILAGRDAGWQTQRRDDGTVERRELYRKYGIPTLCGVAMAASAYAVSLPLLLWMSPVILGLVFAVPIGALTASPACGKLFGTPEEREAPAVLRRANELSAGAEIGIKPALVELREDAALLAFHLAQLPPARAVRPDMIDANLAVGRAKIDASDSFEQAAAHLSPREVFATLNDGSALSTVLRKR